MASIDDYPLLLNNPGFADLDREVVEQMLDLAQTITLEPGQTLYSQGQRTTSVYAAMKGTMRLGLTTPEGREFVLAYMSNGLLFGESGFFDRLPMHHGAAALTEVELLAFPFKSLQELLDKHPILYKSMSLLLARRTRIVIEMLTGFSRDGFERRLAKRILLLASTYGVQQDEGVCLQVAQEELGAMLGVTRQSIYKTLKRWEEEGWVKSEYGALTLLSTEAITALSTA
ncbi:Crp/Fnr family transcriptional regulator [Maricurvus nonylphenolicus]|uniref:Crp/Fnr family transcriptional regulator n=1 Tax=Maricurvus nonylphenolicus TaxID=1008307 RepID=UPI0036F1C791